MPEFCNLDGWKDPLCVEGTNKTRGDGRIQMKLLWIRMDFMKSEFRLQNASRSFS
jgi:hypothetical protein